MENKENIHILNLSTYSQPAIIEDGKNDWIEYGDDNLHYDFLIDRYKNSVTSNSIINNVSRLIYGKGLGALDASKKPSEFAHMKALFKPKTLRALGFNEYMLGCGVIQCIFDEKHTKVVRVEAVKTKHVRPAKCNEDGEIEAYYYSDNWEETKKFPPKRIPAFGTSKERIEFLVYGKDSIDLKYFSEVDYQAAIPYAVLEEEISKFLINDTLNSFSGTKIINFNSGNPSEEQKRLIANKVKGQLTGSQGDKVIVAFNDSAEEKTTIDDISLDNAASHYEYLSKEAQAKILNNHNVVSPMIVGITTEASGFSSNGDEIEVATKFFYNQTVKPHQELLIDAIDEILAFNGISLKLYFENLNYLHTREEVQDEVQEADTKLSAILESFGEEETDEWEVIDSRPVDYDTEDSLNMEFNNFGKSVTEKVKDAVVNFATTGTARPNTQSAMDKEIDGVFYKVRYKYTGSTSGQREFCNKMMALGKVYRREDITAMSKQPVNPGFGPEGSRDKYDIFKYKGGPRCSHYWTRITFRSTSRTVDANSPLAPRTTTGQAKKEGYNPKQDWEGNIMPRNMAHKGYHPNNPNKPSDAQ